MKTIHFCRHGESTANKQDIIAGTLDVPLTQEGIVSASLLSKRLEGVTLDHVLASRLKRATHTARFVAHTHNLLVQELDELREVCFGEAQGGPRFVRGQLSVLEKLELGLLRDAETLGDLDLRAKECWKKLRELPGSTICVVGHRSFTAIMFAVNDGVPPEGFVVYRKAFDFANGEIKTITL